MPKLPKFGRLYYSCQILTKSFSNSMTDYWKPQRFRLLANNYFLGNSIELNRSIV